MQASFGGIATRNNNVKCWSSDFLFIPAAIRFQLTLRFVSCFRVIVARFACLSLSSKFSRVKPFCPCNCLMICFFFYYYFGYNPCLQLVRTLQVNIFLEIVSTCCTSFKFNLFFCFFSLSKLKTFALNDNF